MIHPPFAVKNRKRPKTAPLRQGVHQETGATARDEDQELIQRAIVGDSEAQAQLFATYTPKLYRMAFNVLRNKEDAEDAVQDGWCRAYSKLHTFQGRSSVSTWLTRIVINSALMIRRRNNHVQISLHHADEDRRELLCDLIDDGPNPEETCSDGELKGLLVQEIHRLPSSTRAALLLRDVDELTVEESTKLLGIRKSAMKSRTLRARQKLAQRMLPLLRTDPKRRPFLVNKDSCGANCPAASNTF